VFHLIYNVSKLNHIAEIINLFSLEDTTLTHQYLKLLYPNTPQTNLRVLIQCITWTWTRQLTWSSRLIKRSANSLLYQDDEQGGTIMRGWVCRSINRRLKFFWPLLVLK